MQVNQSFLNRILGVGEGIIATAGDEPEFSVAELPDPHEVREAIKPGAGDAVGRLEPSGIMGEGAGQDRQEATKLFVAAAVALILLVLFGACRVLLPDNGDGAGGRR